MLPQDLLDLLHTPVDELTDEIQNKAVARLSDHLGPLLEKEGFPKNELTLYAILVFGVRSMQALEMPEEELIDLIQMIYLSTDPEGEAA
jgi:hypothetical protein